MKVLFVVSLLAVVGIARSQTALPPSARIPKPEGAEASAIWGQRVRIDQNRGDVLLANLEPLSLNPMDYTKGNSLMIFDIMGDGSVVLQLTEPGYGHDMDVKKGLVASTSHDGTIAFFRKVDGSWEKTQVVDTGRPTNIVAGFKRFGHKMVLGEKFLFATYFSGSNHGVWLMQTDGMWDCVGRDNDGKCSLSPGLARSDFADAFKFVDGDMFSQVVYEDKPHRGKQFRVSVENGEVKLTEVFSRPFTSSNGIRGGDFISASFLCNSVYVPDVFASDSFSWSEEAVNFNRVALQKGEYYTSYVRGTVARNGTFDFIVNHVDPDTEDVQAIYALTSSYTATDMKYVGAVSDVAFAKDILAVGAYNRVFKDLPDEQFVFLYKIMDMTTESPQPSATESPSASVSVSPSASVSASPSATATETPGKTPDETATPSQTPNPTASLQPTAEPVCFSASSKVSVLQKSGDVEEATMDRIQSGDLVQAFDKTGKSVFSEVVLVQHEGVQERRELLQIEYKVGGIYNALRVTRNHYIVTETTPVTYTLSETVKVGDGILIMKDGEAHRATVTSVTITHDAVRNLLTFNDMIVVDGVLSTSYTSVLNMPPRTQSLLITPLKLIHMLGLTRVSRALDRFAHQISIFSA